MWEILLLILWKISVIHHLWLNSSQKRPKIVGFFFGKNWMYNILQPFNFKKAYISFSKKWSKGSFLQNVFTLFTHRWVRHPEKIITYCTCVLNHICLMLLTVPQRLFRMTLCKLAYHDKLFKYFSCYTFACTRILWTNGSEDKDKACHSELCVETGRVFVTTEMKHTDFTLMYKTLLAKWDSAT